MNTHEIKSTQEMSPERTSPRVTTEMSVEIWKTADVVASATARDISEDGGSFYGPRRFEIGDVVMIRMNLPGRKFAGAMRGRVVWRRESMAGWHHGVAWVESDS